MSDTEGAASAAESGKPKGPQPTRSMDDTSTSPAEREGLPADQSGNPAVQHGATSAPKSAPEAMMHEFVDQVLNPQNPLGPFSDPHATMIAGIEEHVGYIPGWLLFLLIMSVVLAMLMWIPFSGY